MLAKDISRIICRVMAVQHYTPEILSQRSGVNAGTIRRIQRGEDARLSTLLLLFEELGLELKVSAK